MNYLNKNWQIALTLLLVIVFCAPLAFAQRTLPPPPPKPPTFSWESGGSQTINSRDSIKITNLGADANVGNPPATEIIPAIIGNPSPAVSNGSNIKDVKELPRFTSLEYTVELELEGDNLYLIPRFTGKGPFVRGDGFIVKFDFQCATDRWPGQQWFAVFYQSGEKICVPRGQSIAMLWPVAKGSFSVSTWDEKTATMVTTLQEGYVQGELWQQVMNTNSGNFFLHMSIMSPPPERLVSWNDIKRSPRLLVKEEPAYYGKDRIQPKYPVVPGQVPAFPLRSRCGFWVQPFFTNPVPGARFDGLFQTYIDQSMMDFGASGAEATGAPGPQFGRTKNLIATLGDNEFRSWIDYYPEDHLYSVLYVRAWVMDHTPGNNRYIVPLPAMSRKY